AVSAGRDTNDAEARLAAAMLMASMVAAYEKGLASQLQGEDPREAMVQVIVRGATGVLAALAGTPYTDPHARP
ncbi:MAG: TetR family transcriptional regulator, partial [Stenotrophomonas maltophilia]